MSKRITAFGRATTLVEHRDFEAIVTDLASEKRQSAYFCNVHMLMLSQEDESLARAMDSADWVFADGVPVAWLQGRISGRNAQVVRGYEITLAVCERAVRTGEKIGFIGSTPDVMTQLVEKLQGQFEGLQVTYQYCPPFMQGELLSTDAELSALNSSGIDWLFVGLGCPKQEKWIARYKDRMDCHVLAVGAAFDWLSGTVSKPPAWMERHALAWFYRLLENPSKMWRRYLIYNTKFLLASMRLLIERTLISRKIGRNDR